MKGSLWQIKQKLQLGKCCSRGNRGGGGFTTCRPVICGTENVYAWKYVRVHLSMPKHCQNNELPKVVNRLHYWWQLETWIELDKLSNKIWDCKRGKPTTQTCQQPTHSNCQQHPPTTNKELRGTEVIRKLVMCALETFMLLWVCVCVCVECLSLLVSRLPMS